MIRDRLERIRERAYALWERAGGGHGQDETHWHAASAEIDAEDPPKRAKASLKPTAAPGGAAAAKSPPKPKATKAAASNGVEKAKATVPKAEPAGGAKSPRAKTVAAKPPKPTAGKTR